MKLMEDLSDLPTTVHLIAVCGTGMGALAGMLKEAGLQVTGSDHRVYPPMSTFLEGMGIHIMEGFRPENLSHRPGIVVVGNAVSRDNPEVVKMFEMGLPYLSLPEAINFFFVNIYAGYIIPGFSKAGSCDQSNISCSNYGDFHKNII